MIEADYKMCRLCGEPAIKGSDRFEAETRHIRDVRTETVGNLVFTARDQISRQTRAHISTRYECGTELIYSVLSFDERFAQSPTCKTIHDLRVRVYALEKAAKEVLELEHFAVLKDALEVSKEQPRNEYAR